MWWENVSSSSDTTKGMTGSVTSEDIVIKKKKWKKVHICFLIKVYVRPLLSWVRNSFHPITSRITVEICLEIILFAKLNKKKYSVKKKKKKKINLTVHIAHFHFSLSNSQVLNFYYRNHRYIFMCRNIGHRRETDIDQKVRQPLRGADLSKQHKRDEKKLARLNEMVRKT